MQISPKICSDQIVLVPSVGASQAICCVRIQELETTSWKVSMPDLGTHSAEATRTEAVWFQRACPSQDGVVSSLDLGPGPSVLSSRRSYSHRPSVLCSIYLLCKLVGFLPFWSQ